MPITRRKRANPPEQPEDNNNNHGTEPATQGAEPAAAAPAPVPPAESAAPPALPERVDIVSPAPTRFANPSMANGDHAIARSTRPRLKLRVADARRAVNFSVARHSHHLCLRSQWHRQRRRACSHRRVKFRCHWATCCTWPTIPVIPAQMKRAANSCISWPTKAKLVAARAVGIVAPLPSSMTGGAHVVKHLEK